MAGGPLLVEGVDLTHHRGHFIGAQQVKVKF